MAAQGNICALRIFEFDKVYSKVRPQVDVMPSEGGRIALDNRMIHGNVVF